MRTNLDDELQIHGNTGLIYPHKLNFLHIEFVWTGNSECNSISLRELALKKFYKNEI